MNKHGQNLYIMGMGNLFSKGYNENDITAWDITNMLDEDVCNVATDLYVNVIKWLSEGKTYDEIYALIDTYDSLEYSELLVEQKAYVKNRVKKDVNKRINKLKGEDK